MNDENTQTPSKKNKNVGRIVVLVIILAIIGVGVWFVASGRVVVIMKQPSETVAVDQRVCGEDVISVYNSAFKEGTKDQFVARLKDAQDKAASLKNADLDPTCVFVKFMSTVQSGDTAAAGAQVDILQRLAQEGRFASSQLSGVMSPEAASILVKAQSQGSDTPGTTQEGTPTNGNG